jgi:hypothetical protein
MTRLKAFSAGKGYRRVVIGVFLTFVILSLGGSTILSAEYYTVFDTVARFNPYIVALTKGYTGEDSRLITLYLKVPNVGNRPIHVYEYGIYLYLNDHNVAHVDVYPDWTLPPASNETLVVYFTITGGFAEFIIQAEQSGQWNWNILFPMRFDVGWLSITASQLGQSWVGIEEVV